MGQHADDIINHFLDRAMSVGDSFTEELGMSYEEWEEFKCEQMYEDFQNGCLMWQQKNDLEINVRDMKLSHINNVINFLQRKDHNMIRETWIILFGMEKERRVANRLKKHRRRRK